MLFVPLCGKLLLNFTLVPVVIRSDKGLATFEFPTYRYLERNVGAVKVLAVSEGAELVRKCRAGDGAAWEEIVQSYSRRIYNLAYRFTSRKI